jgi:hypothetical protein
MLLAGAMAQTTDKLIKEANALFIAEAYVQATPKYLQLLSLEPRNHFYNYRYGACLLFNSEKKPEALKYLKFAITDPNIDPEAHYFLARAYHVNYYFDKAIREYRVYKSKVKDKTASKKDVDRQIEMCQNGLKLMSKISDVIVKERKSSSYEEFFRLYNLRDIGGSIIVTEDFQSKVDKKRGHRPVMHIAENASIIFYSSYGDVDDGHKDIYYRTLDAKGEWSSPIKVSNAVNTPFDEDFPYLDPNGEYLYFSSKGHNSMGGYDVFRVRFDPEKLTFGSVDNLDFAISSPDDDLFYVVDKDYEHAYFASARQSEGGKIHVYRVLVNKFNSNAVMYAGNFMSTADPSAKSANITIKDKATGRIIDNVKTNTSNGQLAFSLPRGGSYEFLVQTERTKVPQVISFEAPFLEESQLLRLNFLEEQAGSTTNIRVVLDVNYQFNEEERSDILAALFLAKSELQPNEGLLEMMNVPERPVVSNSAVLSELKLEKYNPNELAQIAETDLNRLKDNFRRNEEQRQVFLFMASESMDKAQRAEQRIKELIALSESRGLTEKELKELKEFNEKRNSLLREAKTALNNANKLQENAPTIQVEIGRADAILQKMLPIKTAEDLSKLNELSPEERVYMSERFNKIEALDPVQTLGLNNSSNRIQEIDRVFAEAERILDEIEANKRLLKQAEEELENAKKKDKPAIQARIDELLTVEQGLELKLRTSMQNQDKIIAERDSLRHLNQVYQNSLSVNPSQVASNNNVRLINAKLNAEQAKKIDQATQTAVANNVVPDASVIEALNLESNTESNTDLAKREAERTQVQQAITATDNSIKRIDAQLAQVPQSEAQTRLKLEEDKLKLLQEQSSNYRKLAQYDKDDVTVQSNLQRLETQASVSENKIAEFRNLAANTNTAVTPNTESNTDLAKREAERTQVQQAITATDNSIKRIDAQLAQVPQSEAQTRLKLEEDKLKLLQEQSSNYRKLSQYDKDDVAVQSNLQRLETQASVSENKIAELRDLAANTNTAVTPNTESNTDLTKREAERTQVQQAITATDNSIKRIDAQLAQVPQSDSQTRLKLEEDKLKLLQEQSSNYRKLAQYDKDDVAVQSNLQRLETQASVSENKIAELRDLAANTNTAVTPNTESNTDLAKREAERTQVQQAITATDNSIKRIEAQLAQVPQSEAQTRLKLEEDKLKLLQEQSSNYRKLAQYDKDDVAVQSNLQRLETQSSVSENKIAELRDLAANTNTALTPNTESNTDLAKREAERTQVQQAITATDNSIKRIDAQLAQVPQSESQTRLKLEEDKLKLLQEQSSNYRKLAQYDKDDVAVQSNLQRLETQATVSENKIAELQDLVASSSNPVVEQNQLASTERAQADLKKSQEQFLFRNRLVEPDEAKPEDVKAVGNYVQALESLQAQNKNDAAYVRVLQEEKETMMIWMNRVPTALASSDATTSSLATTQQNLVGTATPEMQRIATEIETLQAQSEALTKQLEVAQSKSETTRLKKELERVERAIAQNQIDLVIAEGENYNLVVEEAQRASAQLPEDPLLRAEILLLEQKAQEAQTAVEKLDNTPKQNRVSVMEDVTERRAAFLNQRDVAQREIVVQNEIARVVAATDLNPKVLADPNRAEFALLQINSEIEKVQQELEALEKRSSSAKKSELPALSREKSALEEKKAALESLQAETQMVTEQQVSGAPLVNELPRINSSVDIEALRSVNEEEIKTIVSNPDFITLRNDIVAFTALQNRTQNLVNQQVVLRNEMKATVLSIAQTEDAAERAVLRSKLDALSKEYQRLNQEIEAASVELTVQQQKINNNVLYKQNPTLYHTLSMSPQVQESLAQTIKANAESAAASTENQAIPGITFSADAKTAATSTFGLNPVNIPGMIYKVQIGAFNRPVDLSRFAGFEPVTTDQVGTNIIRYSAGIFYTKNQAFQALNPIKGMGYSDAFVVAYCDGVRYSIAEADELLRQGKCSLNQNAELAFETSAPNTSTNTPTAPAALNYHKGPNAAPAEPLESAEGLLFTVQIGVFNSPISHQRLQNLSPLNTHKTERNQIRYSVGRFDAVEDAIQQRDAVRPMGFSDAFVVAYYNGERITIAEARKILDAQGPTVLHSQRVLANSSATLSGVTVLQLDADSTNRVEQLNKYPLGRRFVSTATYTEVPVYEISKLRSQGIWAYYEARSGRVMSSFIDNVNNVPSGFEIQYVYQGFGVQDKNSVTLNTLIDFDPSVTYYQVEINWEGEMPRLLAYYLQQNFSEYLASWNPELGQIRFLPLTFAQKEQLKRVFAYLNDKRLNFTEDVVRF